MIELIKNFTLSKFYINLNNAKKTLKLEVSGGPVNHEYNFLQFHMHWGDNLHRGSEHLINGHAHAAEVFKFILYLTRLFWS